MDGGCLIVDGRGVIRTISPRLAQALGYPRRTLIGDAASRIVTHMKPEDWPGHVAVLHRHQISLPSYPYPLRRSDGLLASWDPDAYQCAYLSRRGEPMARSHGFVELGLTDEPRVVYDQYHRPVAERRGYGRTPTPHRGTEAPEMFGVALGEVVGRIGSQKVAVTFDAAIDMYRAHPQFTTTTPKHQREVLRVLDQIAGHAGWRQISDLDAIGLETYMAEVTERFGNPQSANHALKYARAFATWAHRRRLIPEDPFSCVQRIRDTRGRTRRALALDEIEALVNAAREGRHVWRGDLYRFAFLTGLRKGEIQAMTWGWIEDREDGSWIVIPGSFAKARRGQQIPLTTEARSCLRPRAEDDRVWPCVPTVKTFDRDLRNANIPKEKNGAKATFHSLRHSLATHLANAGVAPQVAQLLMRHASISTTIDTYTDRQLLDLRSASEKVGLRSPFRDGQGAENPNNAPDVSLIANDNHTPPSACPNRDTSHADRGVSLSADSAKSAAEVSSRGGEIRTRDLLTPRQSHADTRALRLALRAARIALEAAEAALEVSDGSDSPA